MGPSGVDGSNRVIGRYALHGVIASGGMANVHLGRLLGLAGFSRIVAVKRLHAIFARDPEFVSMLIDEARLAARIRHPNVVAMLDVVALEGELLLVMEYVHGESLGKLIVAANKAKQRIPVQIALTIIAGTLYGLHAAHEARNDRGEPFELVHRDVSPQNIQVGVDGVARVLDFGIAKAAGRLQDTKDNQLKGRLRYMAPEQLKPGGTVDRRTDIYSASAVLWEALTGRSIFKAESDWQMAHLILEGVSRKLSELNPEVSPELEAIVMRGLAVKPEDRFQTAYDMAVALEEIGPISTPREVGLWVEDMAADALADRSARVDQVEGKSRSVPPPPPMSVDEVHDSESFPAPPSVPPVDNSGPPSDPATPPSVEPASSRQPPGEHARNPRALVGVGVVVVVACALLLWLALSPSVLQAHVGLSGISGRLAGVVDRATVKPPQPEPLAALSAAVAPDVVGSTGPAGSTSHQPAPAKVPRTLPKPAGNCNPPYFFDAEGVKRLKRECL
jgi:serine/threonine-protein kinase